MSYFSPDVYAGIDLSQFNGMLPFKLTNDYFFRAVMQENNHVLKALVCSLLHLNEEEVREVTILNPIILGSQIDEKDFLLDIFIRLDNRMVINLELQVINEGNWVERSLSYLCRSFDNLNKGKNYSEVLPTVQIGILNFTLFEDAPEFFATYKMMNEKSHRKYSDKLRISVLDLTQIDLATEDDTAYKIDYWARLFKATTWKELKAMTKQYPVIEEAAQTAAVLGMDERIRQLCDAREDYYRRYGWMKDANQKMTSEIQKQASEIQQLTYEKQRQASEIQQLTSETQQQASEIQQQASEIQRLRLLLANAGIQDPEES